MYVRVTSLILINCFKTSEVVHRFLCDLPYTFVNLHKGSHGRGKKTANLV